MKKKEEKEAVGTEEETSKETKKPVKEKKDELLEESELEETVEEEVKQEINEIINEQMFTEFMGSGLRISSSLDQVAIAAPARVRIEAGPDFFDEDENEEIKYAMTSLGSQDTKYISSISGDKFYSENDQRIDYSPDTGSLVRDTTTSNFQRDTFFNQAGIDPLTAMGIQRREDINMGFTQPGLWGIKKKRLGEKDEDRRYITK